MIIRNVLGGSVLECNFLYSIVFRFELGGLYRECFSVRRVRYFIVLID